MTSPLKPISKPILGGTNPTYAAPPNRPNLTAMANSLPKAPPTLPVTPTPTYAAPPKPGPMPTPMPVPASQNDANARMLVDMARNAIAGKGVQNPTVTPAAPPKGYVDDLNYLNKPLPTKANPTYAAPPKPMPMPMPPTGTTGTPPATGPQYMKKGGKVKSSSAKSKVSTASSRGDGIAQRGKTKGRMV